jgi:hypothetical protein
MAPRFGLNRPKLTYCAVKSFLFFVSAICMATAAHGQYTLGYPVVGSTRLAGALLFLMFRKEHIVMTVVS